MYEKLIDFVLDQLKFITTFALSFFDGVNAPK